MVVVARPNYVQAILDAIRSGKIKTGTGQVVHADIRHDDWCNIFKGGVCNCNPEVSFRPAQEARRG